MITSRATNTDLPPIRPPEWTARGDERFQLCCTSCGGHHFAVFGRPTHLSVVCRDCVDTIGPIPAVPVAVTA